MSEFFVNDEIFNFLNNEDYMPKVTTPELEVGKAYTIEYFTLKNTSFGESLCAVVHHELVRKIYFFPETFKRNQQILVDKLRQQKYIKAAVNQKLDLIYKGKRQLHDNNEMNLYEIKR